MRYVVLTLSMGFAGLWAQNGATSTDWPSYGGTQLAWRYSALDQINTSNVKKLVPVWQFQTGDYAQGLQSTPIVIDGVLYLSTTHSQVFALDAVTGKMIWQYKYPMPRGAGGNIQNRGIAVGAGKVFVGTYDDYVVAIDQKTGVEAWKTAMADSSQCGCSITGAPLLVKDKVIIGEAGGDGAFRGFLTALDAKTGRVAWRFYTIPGPGEKGNETWKGDSWKYGGGATWMTGSFDRDLNRFIGAREMQHRICIRRIVFRGKARERIFIPAASWRWMRIRASSNGTTRRFRRMFGITTRLMSAC